MPKFCNKCGEAYEPGDETCGGCGRSFKEKATGRSKGKPKVKKCGFVVCLLRNIMYHIVLSCVIM